LFVPAKCVRIMKICKQCKHIHIYTWKMLHYYYELFAPALLLSIPWKKTTSFYQLRIQFIHFKKGLYNGRC
jgi:hypothetical protein